MTIEENYTPSLSLLSKSGMNLTSFHPEAEIRDSLLHRIALEWGSVTGPVSYYAPQRRADGRKAPRFPLDNPFIFLYHIEERRRTAQSLI